MSVSSSGLSNCAVKSDKQRGWRVEEVSINEEAKISNVAWPDVYCEIYIAEVQEKEQTW